MKTIFKVTRTGSVSILTAMLLLVTPSYAMTSTPAATAPAANGACARFTTLAAASSTKINERIAAMEVDFQRRLTIISGRHDAVDLKVATFRTTALDKFDLKMDALKSEKNLTPEQVTAIEEFVNNMKEAEVARVQTVDSTRATYRSAMLEEVNARQAHLLQAALVFQRSVAASFTKAQSTCADATAGTTLRSEIKTARETFRTARKAEVIESSVKQLAETRRSAVKVANEEFIKKVKEYTATLKSALEIKS